MRRLLLFTGMGADERLFAPQRQAFPDAIVAPWLNLLVHESLVDYARRAAAEFGVGPDWVVGGVSMGGMIAQEVARCAGASRVVLIASCRHPRAVNRGAIAIERAARLVPDTIVQMFRRARNNWLIDILGPRTDEQRKLLSQMSDATPVPRLRWCARAIFEWPGAEDLCVPIHQIHGTRDHVIMCRRSGAHETIAGGGHVINLTHPDEVNRVMAHAIEA